MSAEINNGGPAFPTENAMQTGPSSYRYEGMTVREYFAAHAPITLAEAGEKYRLNNGNGTLGDVVDYLAKLRWAYADAMLKMGKSK